MTCLKKSKCVLYSSPFVPVELISVYGLRPVKIPFTAAGSRTLRTVEGLCPIADAFLGAIAGAPDAAGYVNATSCDQMRRLGDYLGDHDSERLFTIGLPADPESPDASGYYRNELVALSRYLSKISGIVLAKDELASRFISVTRLNGKSLKQRAMPDGSVRLALIGGPMSIDKEWIARVFKSAGAVVVLDGCEGGERTAAGRIDERVAAKDPFRALTKAYFDTIPDVFFRPNDRLYVWIKKMFAERKPAGVILMNHLWCDLWKAEESRIRKETGLPFLSIELTDACCATESIKTRLEAFVEALKKRKT